MQSKTSLRYVLILVLVSLVWAGSFVVVKIGTRNISPIHIGFLRFLVATPLMFLVILLKKEKPRRVNYKDLPAFVILALTGVTLLYVFQFTGIKYTTASTSAVLINTNVMFIAILSFLVLRESFTLKKVVGIILGFLGATIIVTNGYLDIGSSFLGDVLILLSAFCWAVYSVIGKILLKRYNPLTLNTYAFALGTIFYIPFVINDFGSIFFIILEGWLIILYLALFCSVFGYVAWYFVLSHVDASKAAIFLNLIPLFTILLSLLIGEIVTISLIAGAACIIYGIYLTQKE